MDLLITVLRELRQRLLDPFLGMDKLELMDLARLAEERSWHMKGEHVSQHTEDERVSELQAIVEEQRQQLAIQRSQLAELEEETVRQAEVRYSMTV